MTLVLEPLFRDVVSVRIIVIIFSIMNWPSGLSGLTISAKAYVTGETCRLL